MGGMVSVSELSSKRRKVEEAKDTDRLQPKREAVGYSSPFWEYTERSKPVFLLPMTGKQTVRNAEWSAGIGLQKKRMPPCNGVNRD